MDADYGRHIKGGVGDICHRRHALQPPLHVNAYAEISHSLRSNWVLSSLPRNHTAPPNACEQLQSAILPRHPHGAGNLQCQ